jgi:hypothetical protein
MKNTLFSF